MPNSAEEIIPQKKLLNTVYRSARARFTGRLDEDRESLGLVRLHPTEFHAQGPLLGPPYDGALDLNRPAV